MKNIHGVKIYTVSISRSQKLHGQKNTETNKIHGIEIHGAESAHRKNSLETLVLYIQLRSRFLMIYLAQ